MTNSRGPGDDAERLDLTLHWNGLSLAGTLHHPAGTGPYPTVLMMQGSGPSDRDSNGYFPGIRDVFLDRGIAAYSFDKPGCGSSTGDWRDYALEGRADQAISAVGLLRAHPLVDSQNVGVWGQSQGGWLAQILASRLHNLAFAITNSGPSIGVVEQDLYGCENEMRQKGHDEADIERALHFIEELHRAARRQVSYEEVEAQLLRDAREQPWYGYATVDDADDWALGSRFVQEGYEPLEALVQIQCPFLAIFGGRDVLVPAWRGAEEAGDALRRAGNRDATVAVFPQANHRLQDEETGGFVSGYLDLLGDWTARRVVRRAQ